MSLLQASPLRLAVLDASGAKLKTLILPTPVEGGLELEWVDKLHTWELDDGGELTRTLGYLPQLTVKWTYYDERPAGRYPLGTDNGQRPSLEDLLVILSQPSGRLRVSPGLSAGGFTVDRCQVKPIGRRGLVYSGVQVVFRGRYARPTRSLEAF